METMQLLAQLTHGTRKLNMRYSILEAFVIEITRELSQNEQLAPALQRAAHRTQLRVTSSLEERSEAAHPELDAEALALLRDMRAAAGLPEE